MRAKCDEMERNVKRVRERLAAFVNALGDAAGTTAKKEGRRELVVKLQEQSQLQLKSLAKVKRKFIHAYSRHSVVCRHLFHNVYIAECAIAHARAYFMLIKRLLPTWRLESAYVEAAREMSPAELTLIEQVLQSFGVKADEPKFSAQFALAFGAANVGSNGETTRAEMERWWCVECRCAGSSSGGFWPLGALVELVDKRQKSDYAADVKLFRDLMPLCNGSQKLVCGRRWLHCSMLLVYLSAGNVRLDRACSRRECGAKRGRFSTRRRHQRRGRSTGGSSKGVN